MYLTLKNADIDSSKKHKSADRYVASASIMRLRYSNQEKYWCLVQDGTSINLEASETDLYANDQK